MTYFGSDPLRRLSETISAFSEVRVAERTNIIELKSIYGTSALRDLETLAGSATIASAASGEIQLTTTANGPDYAELNSAERGRYIPGDTADIGIGVRLGGEGFANNAYAEWGLDDGTEGFGFGEDATGVYVYTRRNGTQTKVYQSSWNVDVLDGTGRSGVTLDTTDGTIFQMHFAWYGYGVIEFQVVDQRTTSLPSETLTVHRFRPVGATSVQTPNLPIRAILDNNSDATARTMFVGGRKYATVGKFTPNRRKTSERRLELGSVDTTFLPTVSFRRKSAFLDVGVKVDKIQIITDADLLWQLRLNEGLTSASYGTPTDHTAAETALEADISATATDGAGEVLDQGIIAGGAGRAEILSSVERLDFDLIAQQPVTVAVRRFSGTGATVSVNLAMREEW